MTDRGSDETPLPVQLRNLSLQAFRNYSAFEFEPDPGLTLIVGPNGQGKTNLVEAIYFLCLGRSFRERSDKRLIMFGERTARLDGIFSRAGEPREIRMIIDQEAGKKVLIDGVGVERLRDLVGEVPVVGFTPEDNDIVKGDPASRRRFLDLVLAQTSREYLESLQRYRRALAQRNASLRGGQVELLESWEEALVENGTVIREHRARLVEYLSDVAVGAYREIGPIDESFTIDYRPRPVLENGGEEELALALESGREDDLERGFTGTGPHRDDLNLEVGARHLRMYGSHGQARTALATLKLGEVAYYTHARERQPILIMDEVASVLDRDRTGNLIALLSREASQVFITSPTEEGFGHLTSRSGCVVRVDEEKANN